MLSNPEQTNHESSLWVQGYTVEIALIHVIKKAFPVGTGIYRKVYFLLV